MSIAADSNGPKLGPDYSHLLVKDFCRLKFQFNSQTKLYDHFYVVLGLEKYNNFATVELIYSPSESQPDMKEFPSIIDQKVVPLNGDDLCSLNIINVSVKLLKELLESKIMLLIKTTQTPLLKHICRGLKRQIRCCLHSISISKTHSNNQGKINSTTHYNNKLTKLRRKHNNSAQAVQYSAGDRDRPDLIKADTQGLKSTATPITHYD